MIYFYAFGFTILALLIITVLTKAEPEGQVSPAVKEFFGVFVFVFIAIMVSFLASFTQDLPEHEEDILLTIPVEDSTIVQSKLIQIVLLLPIPILFGIFALLGVETSYTGVDSYVRLPYAFASVLLFTIIVLGGCSVIQGLWRRYYRITSRLGNYVFLGLIILVFSALFMLMYSGPQFFVDMYYHPFVRFLLIIPISSSQIYFFGGPEPAIFIQLIVQSMIAFLLLAYAFRFKYELWEVQLSPLKRTTGRGEERESPPLPSILDKLSKVLHISYLDLGKDWRAVFGLCYTLSFSPVMVFALMLVLAPMLLHFDVIGSVRRFELYIVMWGPIYALTSWLLGMFLAMMIHSQVNLEILRTVPVRGRKSLLSLVLPGLIMVGILYLIWMLFGLLMFEASPINSVLNAMLVVPIMFISSFISMTSILIMNGPIGTKYAPEGARPSGSIAVILVAVYPGIGILLYVLPMIVARDLIFGFVGIFLLISLSMPLAYYLFESAAENLSSLKALEAVQNVAR